jgi:hypothetical protein
MLSGLERKLTSIIADGLASRPHLAVLQAPATPPPLAPGKGDVAVAVTEVIREAGFTPADTALTGAAGARRSRRILPLRLTARVELRLRPADDSAAAQADARSLLLEDLSAVAHLLAEGTVRAGTAFAVADPDPGFQVTALELGRGSAPRALVDGALGAVLELEGGVEVWPAGVEQAAGEILGIEATVAAQPLALRPDDAAVPAGGSTRLRLRTPAARFLAAGARPGGLAVPLRIAVSVVSDLPPAQRGTIGAGDPGVETGVRLLPVATPETVILYQAPAGVPGPVRVEYVAVHLATADGRSGIFLGSAPVRLAGAPP